MYSYLNGEKLWDLIEQEIYYQVENIVLDFRIDDLISIFNASMEDCYCEEIAIESYEDYYILGDEKLTENEVRQHIFDCVGHNWDLGLDVIIYEHKNEFNIPEVDLIIKEIKEIQDALCVYYKEK